MANQVGKKAYNTFVKGLITEATTLNFPEGASVDEDNFVLLRDGSRQRRFGMDYEDSYTLEAISATSVARTAVTSHYWFSAQPGVHFSVVQFGATLYFYDATATSFSSPSSYDMTPHITSYYSTSEMEKHPLDFTSIKGVLFVTGRSIEPVYITYDGTSFTGTEITLSIRDFVGVDDGLAIDERPSRATGLSITHKYNLYNQGWGKDVNLAAVIDSDTPTLGDPIAKTDAVLEEYPSNADIWHIALNASGYYWPEELDSVSLGASRAPRGSQILNTFDKDRSTVTSIAGLTRYVEKNRPEAVKAFSGRVFWAGINSSVAASHSNGPNSTPTTPYPEKSQQSTIWFSPALLEDFSVVGNCYQAQDPTSNELSDVLATDGGTITIPDAGRIIGLAALPSALLVFSEEGVWTIGGSGDGSTFAADSIYVRRLTSVGCLNKRSIVVAESAVFYWSDGGIYIIAEGEAGIPQVQNITQTTIQGYYNDDIPRASKTECAGFYDSTQKKVKWLFSNESPASDGLDAYVYDRELVFDMVLQAFYKNSISTSTPYVAGFVPISGETTVYDVATIIANGHPVVATNGADTGTVIETQEVFSDRGTSNHKYITIVPVTGSTAKLTFSLYKNTSFLDWYGYDNTGVDFKSYLVSGYDNFGDLTTRKRVSYLQAFFNRTESAWSPLGGDIYEYTNQSGCFMQSRWDFSDSGSSGKWSNKQQVYRLNKFLVSSTSDPDYGYNTIVTKNKIRGSGKVLSVYWESETGKDCHLLGWTVQVVSNTAI